MAFPIFKVDAFASRPFQGNPAAVCLLPGPQDEAWMQSVAEEMNLSETAFVYEEGDGFNLRWFTPVVEVPLCGHATLATSHVLWEEGRISPDQAAVFATASGILRAKRKGTRIELNFPALPPRDAEAPPGLLRGLGVKARYVGRNDWDYLVEVDSEDTVRNLDPDFSLLKTLPQGVIVTAEATTPPYDFVSRFFAPSVGIDEDPVTGAAHCCLGPYWQKRIGASEFAAYQASARGGEVGVRVAGDRVYLMGEAVTILRGKLAI
ncbi:MAG: PhzF family phenazine biosynthesis protein [Thermoplasmata archaeon]